MKKSALVLVMMVLAAAALAQEAGQQPGAMDAWTKAMTPGPVHEFLAQRTGQWKVQGKIWMDPNGEPVTSTSTAVVKMILGGRYMMEEVSGTTMGQPFEGLGMLGYDNTTGVATYVWYDTMGTMTLVGTGLYPRIGDPLEVTGTMVDPSTGAEVSFRTKTTFVSGDETRFEYFTAAKGDQPTTKMMELLYTRIK